MKKHDLRVLHVDQYKAMLALMMVHSVDFVISEIFMLHLRGLFIFLQIQQFALVTYFMDFIQVILIHSYPLPSSFFQVVRGSLQRVEM
jgi:two-component SAPR family response regulator